MKKTKGVKKSSIKVRILKSILTLIALIFLIITVSFNIVVKRYIKRLTHDNLENVRSVIDDLHLGLSEIKIEDLTEDQKLAVFLKLIKHIEEKESKQKINYNTEIMVINYEYDLLFPNVEKQWLKYNENYFNIVNSLKEKKVDLNSDKNINLEVDEKYYYLSFEEIDEIEGDEKYYIVMFIDLTNTVMLYHQINLVLFTVMFIAGVLAVSISIILAKKIAEPIQKLGEFAAGIGDGKFKKCDLQMEDRELSDLLIVMNKSVEDLDKYDKEQKTFFQNISHELRTPLMSIKGYAEAIKYDVFNKEEAVKIILEESERLEDLIEELLYLSRIDNITKDYILEERDLREILSNCVINQKANALKKGIEFKFEFAEETMMVRCNEKSLYRAFLNIIDNAVRYAEKEIVIRCFPVKDEIIVEVEDDGEGISDNDLPLVFNRLYKGRKGKHGIGLSIVKAIMDKNNAIIIAKNGKKGAKFIVKFLE